MISGTVVCVIIRIIAGVFFHQCSYGDYCRDRKIRERGCTVWANVRHWRGAASRIAHPMGQSSQAFGNKSAIEPAFSRYTRRRQKFLPLTFDCYCIQKILPLTNSGLSTPGCFAAWKIWPQGSWVQLEPPIEDGSVTEITGLDQTNCWASLS